MMHLAAGDTLSTLVSSKKERGSVSLYDLVNHAVDRRFRYLARSMAGQLCISDLVSLTADDLMMLYTNAGDKLLIKVFYDTVLHPEYEAYDAMREFYFEIRAKTSTLKLVDWWPQDGAASIDVLFEKEMIAQPTLASQLGDILTLDLSNCGLTNAHALLNICARLPLCQTVILTGNKIKRLSGFEPLLNRYTIVFLSNPIDTTVLSSMEMDHLGNCIWIPFGWFRAGKWKEIFGEDAARVEVVQRTHEEYWKRGS